MTPAEIRKHIVELKQGMATAEANLGNLRESRSLDREILRGIEQKLAELDKRMALVEKETTDRSKGISEARIARVAIVVAVIGFLGAVVSSLIALRK